VAARAYEPRGIDKHFAKAYLTVSCELVRRPQSAGETGSDYRTHRGAPSPKLYGSAGGTEKGVRRPDEASIWVMSARNVAGKRKNVGGNASFNRRRKDNKVSYNPTYHDFTNTALAFYIFFQTKLLNRYTSKKEANPTPTE